jgi:hypothetical protein
MRRIAFTLAALLAASPASAQMTQYWLPNGPGGTTYNNPQGSLSGTYYNNALRRHADQQRWARQRQQPAGAAAGAGAAGSGAAAGGYGQPQGASLNPSFRLNNTGGRTVREVYVSSSNDSHWGPDRLGQHVLGPGRQMVLQLPTGQCVNDIRVVFIDGQAQERRGVNTCALTDFSVR